MRLAFYAGASTAAAAACLLKAFHQRPNFYSASVYLAQSNACLLILTNLVLVLACGFMFALQRLLYGPLRPVEIEQLSEKAWYAVLDTLLAMPSFREDVGGWLLTMFVLLLAGKVWGWIGEGRVDVLEQQPPANPRLFHARLATSLLMSVAFDLWMLNYCVDTVMADPRPGMMVIFTFEFAVLSIFSTFTLSRYFLSLIEVAILKRQTNEALETRKNEIRAERAAARQNETADGRPAPASPPNEDPIEVDENEIDVPGWEEKRRYMFALELFTDFVKLMIYIVFFTVSITFNGLPMHIMRDVYMTFASFSKRVADYVAYRKATSDMNTRYPDATTEEIREDACIVCRESMVAWEQPAAQAPAEPVGDQPPAAPALAARRDEGLRAKKLPCGHILHLRCLKAWLERQQVCPTCRRPVVTAATEAAAQGQPGAPGANPAPPGQPGQPPPRRQNRARIFNLGPVRIGFLNGPGDQIQNVVNQMRNPPAADPNAPPPANQQGPNHLGLQVPYLNDAPQDLPPAPAGRGVSTQIQFMQLEQRLMQEAYNMSLEQQELITLRMMEGELARLRASHLPLDPPVGTATAAQRQAATLQMPGAAPMYHHLPHPATEPEVFQGSVNQRPGVGHDGVPAGLTLPPGWTLMPLQRASAGIGADMNLHPTGVSNVPPSTAPVGRTATVVDGGTQDRASAPAAPPQPTADAAGPTDDNGSPLFVPTPTTAGVNHQPISSTNDAVPPTVNNAPTRVTNGSGPRAPFVQGNAPPPLPGPTEPTVPWSAGADGWNFNADSRTTAASNGHATRPASHGDSTTASAGTDDHEPSSESEGKGKGRTVEVEDAPDSEA